MNITNKKIGNILVGLLIAWIIPIVIGYHTLTPDIINMHIVFLGKCLLLWSTFGAIVVFISTIYIIAMICEYIKK